MAIPDKRDPTSSATHINDLGDQRVVERETRGGWRWWWIWPVIIALVLWWAGWGWGSSGGWWWGRAHAQNTAIPAPAGSRTTETLANAGAKQPLTDNGAGGGIEQNQMSGSGVQILTAQNKQAYIGKRFQASDVPVQQKVSDHALWIGASKPMLAIVSDSGNNAANQLGPGKLVDAIGTVQKAPSEQQARSEWNLSDQDAARLEHEGAYIQISQLVIPKQ